MSADWLAIGTFILNLLFLPLLKVLLDINKGLEQIKGETAVLRAHIEEEEKRLDRIEGLCDRRHFAR